MENFEQNEPEEKVQTEVENETSAEGNDIEFEDDFDIDKVENQLQQLPQNTPQDSSSDNHQHILLPSMPQTAIGSKKYVIYIDPENVDFIENLSIDDRKKIINSILKEQDKKIARKKILNRQKNFLKQAIVVVLTALIAFPAMLWVANKSILISIENYQQASKNFEKLYKERGKIQMKQNFKLDY